MRPLRRLRTRVGLRGLDFLWLEVTRSCNLRCHHCYVSSAPELPLVERMQRADWCRALDEAWSLGCEAVQFVGGEPTIHPDLRALIVHSAKLGYSCREVYTNATLLDDELVEFFKRSRTVVAFSFYSAEAEVHDRLTGQKGSFEKTVSGIKRLVAYKVPLRAGIVVTASDKSALRRTKAFLSRLGVRSTRVDRIRGVGRGKQLATESGNGNELCGACWRGTLCVDARGNVYPCVFARSVRLGNFLDSGMRQIVKGDRLHTFRTEMYLR